VQAVTDSPWVLLYVKRWLAAPLQHPDGILVERDKGTPQGGLCAAAHNDPCGVPLPLRVTEPPSRTPARNIARRSFNSRRSQILSSTADISPECGIASKR
jgi:hypothetical protein